MRSGLCLLFLLLLLPQSLFADSVGIRKIEVSGQTVYLAKSGMDAEEEEVWDIRWTSRYAIANDFVVYVEKKWDNTQSSFAGRILSIVGPYVSYQGMSDGYTQGTAHPWHVVYFKTKNITTGELVKLTDLFSERDVLKVLLDDTVIKKGLKGRSPKTLDELFQQMAGRCDFYLDWESLSHFVFHHGKGDMVAVRLGLSHGCEAARGKFTQLGFYLPIPQELRSSLLIAEQKGLLMDKMVLLKE